MVIRGSYGIFYGRVPADFAAGEIRSDQYRFYTIFQPGTTDRSQISIEGLPYTIEWMLPEEVPSPYTRQFGLGVSRQLTADSAIDIDYEGARGYHEFFPRNDINPLDPLTFTRPLPQYEQVFMMRTDGSSVYDALEVEYRKRFGHNYELRGSYTLSRAENDFDEPHFAGQAFKRGSAA